MAAEPGAEPRGRRVLVVDDEMLICMLVESILIDAGYVVATANSVPEALAAIDTHPIDFAILDLTLRGQSGYDVAEKLAAQGIPFLFATGNGQGPVEFPDRPWIAKPFDEIELLKIIARLSGDESAPPRDST